MISCNTLKSCKRKCDKEYLFFTQFLCEEKIVVPDQKLDIENIVSIIVDPEIVSLRIIDTPVGCSAEGQKLTGKKLSIEIRMRQKVVYISKTSVQSVHVVENECYKSAVIVVPKYICGTKIEHLLSHNYFKVEINVENASATKIDDRNIYKSILLFIKAQVIPCYLLCYSEDYHCHKSELFIAFKDGTKKRKITCFDEGKIRMPQWSPCGQKIAYICETKDSSFLCVSDINGNNMYQLTETDDFTYISGFYWDRDSTAILFSAIFKGSKEIFSIKLSSLELCQLTYSKSSQNNVKPKFSYNSDYVAYIKISNGNRSLNIMKRNGLGNRRITNDECIKDFAWENNSLVLVAVCYKWEKHKGNTDLMLGCSNNGDEILIIDVQCNSSIPLNISKCDLSIKKIKISSDDRYVSFIGENSGTQDIYIFDLLKNELSNLTENQYGVNISDYDWDNEASEIYYACNELDYYNVYFVRICDKSKTQISNTKANNIKLSYRPKML